MKVKANTIWVVEISSSEGSVLAGYAKTEEKAWQFGRKYLEEEKRYLNNSDFSRTLEVSVHPIHRIEVMTSLYKDVNDRREGE